jgi:predicted AlkP superfamily pyrophosphatase or phosphodiesterase
MFSNSWFDRETRKSVACTADPSATSVPYGGRPGQEHHSAKWLATSTFADELRAQATIRPHVMGFSLKARSVIGMLGHGADLAIWEEDAGTWASSSAFAATPSPAFETWAAAHAIDAQYGRIWDRLLPPASYFFDDAGLGEPTSADYPNVFPHAQTRPGGQPDKAFYDTWERTPFVDEALTDMAIQMSSTLGQGPGTDVLAVSYSALDLVGHRWGPTSHEVQDVLVRLDVQLGKLFDALDRRVGAGRYVVGMSADHGVAPIPEQMQAAGLDAGRLTSASINTRVTDAWHASANDASNPIASGGTDMYFTPAALATIQKNRVVRDAIMAAALSAPGIARAYWGDDLAAGDAGDDPVKRAAMLTYFPGRSPDLVLMPREYWMTSSSGTTHGTPHMYDRRVPLALMGFGITPGRYLTSVTPADLAPTLAWLTGITLPRAEGRVLAEATR